MLLLARLNRSWLRLFGIDTILLDCLLYYLTLDLTVIAQGLERGDHDVKTINFEEDTQVFTSIATTEAISTETNKSDRTNSRICSA